MADGINTYTEPLARLANELQPKKILEIGLGYEGYSTQVWLDCAKAKVTSIDKGDWVGTGTKLQQKYPERFEFIKGRAEEIMPALKEKYDLIYIDGNHGYDGAKVDMLNAIPLLAAGGIIALDDYGVVAGGGVDLDDEGRVLSGGYGVREAADEVFKEGWEKCYAEIELANGGVCLRRKL